MRRRQQKHWQIGVKACRSTRWQHCPFRQANMPHVRGRKKHGPQLNNVEHSKLHANCRFVFPWFWCRHLGSRIPGSHRHSSVGFNKPELARMVQIFVLLSCIALSAAFNYTQDALEDLGVATCARTSHLKILTCFVLMLCLCVISCISYRRHWRE